MAQERLQKILAAAGVASRRKAEELITAGRISVNGEKITALGSKADVRNDEIRLDGELLRGPERHVYIVAEQAEGICHHRLRPGGRPVLTCWRELRLGCSPSDGSTTRAKGCCC